MGAGDVGEAAEGWPGDDGALRAGGAEGETAWQEAGGSTIGVSACCVGIWNARTVPTATDTTSSISRPTPCAIEAQTSAAALTACAAMQRATMRARW